MKKPKLKFTEILYLFCFLLFLFASDMTHIEGGSELSLWLMTFAVVLTMAATLFPWLGIQWLSVERQGSRTGRWLVYFIQLVSWGTYAIAMVQRWGRLRDTFHWWITLTGLLWAIWLLIFIYNRYATPSGDTLNKDV